MIQMQIAPTNAHPGYAVGALMYTPALNSSAVDNMLAGKFQQLNSLVFCLEDAILDNCVELAEAALLNSLRRIYTAIDTGDAVLERLPWIFVRVRHARQLSSVYARLGNCCDVVKGFVLPKFEPGNADEYLQTIAHLNANRRTPLYIMPTLETPDIMYLENRIEVLTELKKKIDGARDWVLNVRVGGNDFCNIFGLRRSAHQTIYDIGLLNSVLINILNFFARDYIVSAPVWEYFSGEGSNEWQRGLQRELELDRLNGFIGKTAIHPSQLPIIQKAFMVSRQDYEDAMRILNWDSKQLNVQKSAGQNRMNEGSVHKNWAIKILALAEFYGLKELAG